jgi:anaerobic magnesium-protoporphyrin IX monomethyl ester cyclase
MRKEPLSILFVDAIDTASKVQRAVRPLGLGYLSAVVKQRFGTERVHFDVAIEDVERKIDEMSPDIVAITSTSQNFDVARAHAAVAKQANVTTLIGGYHITMMPGLLSEDMDVGILGEGEQTFLELIAAYLEQDGLKESELLREIPGIVFRDRGTLVHTRPRPPIEPLDTLPFPDRDLLGPAHRVMITSRGCPYRCVYCASTRFWRGVRMFSPEYIVREITYLYDKYRMRHITLFDDLFIIDKERVRRLVELIRAAELHKRVSFNCLATANLVDDEIAELLRKMNVRRVGMGLESGSDRILKSLKGKHASVEANRNAVHTLARHGLEVEGAFVIGAPDETENDMLDTLRFVQENPLDLFEAYLLTPYPGTPLWDYALERGLVSPNMPWDRLNKDFASKPDEPIFLCESTSRERTHEIYLKLLRERPSRTRKKILQAAFKKPLLFASIVDRAARNVWRRIARRET